MCSLAQNCPGLHTLNMTGCVEVGLGGLHGLISGVGEGFVKEAKTFFGFVPRRSMIDRRVSCLVFADEGHSYSERSEHKKNSIVGWRLARVLVNTASTNNTHHTRKRSKYATYIYQMTMLSK